MNRTEELFDAVEPFLQTIRRIGIDEIVLRKIDEFRPLPGVPISPDFRYRKLELLAYLAPVLYKCVLEGHTPLDIGAELARHGIRTRLISGNIT